MEKNEKYITLLKAHAENYCRDLKQPYVGTEHLLLALLAEKNTPVVSFLADHKITFASFKKQIKEVIGEGDYKGDVYNFTPLINNVFEDVESFASSKGLGVTSEMVMLQILRCSEGVAVRLLEAMGFKDREQEAFDNYLCDQISISNLGVDMGPDFDFDIALDSTGGESKKNKYNFLTDLRKSVKETDTRVVGFEKELEELIKALLRYKKPNIILLGEPGVGKTALVEKLAIALNEGNVPPIISNYKILQLSISSALAGTKYRGEFEEKMENMLDMVSKHKDVILFIDEIHSIVGAGASNDSTLDAGNILKPYLSRGAIKVIGATTNEEYERIKEDGALARRFKTMEILEPDKEQTMAILRSMKPVMQKHYGVKLTEKDLKEVYNKSTYRKGRMPDIALDELEEHCIDIYYDNSMKEKENSAEGVK